MILLTIIFFSSINWDYFYLFSEATLILLSLVLSDSRSLIAKLVGFNKEGLRILDGERMLLDDYKDGFRK